MAQPTAEDALKELEVLVGEWTAEAVPPGGEPWPGDIRSTFEWIEDGNFLLQRSHADLPEAPDGVSIYGCDGGNGTYFQLYSDDRGVCRIYEMTIGNGEWTLHREGEPFNQRFTGKISDDGKTIEGRYELDEGDGWKTDFEITYRKVA